MLFGDPDDGVVGFLASPIALPLQQHLLPGHGYHSGLHHTVHGVFVRIGRGAARSVGHHVDLVAAFQHRAEREGGVADFGPEAGDDDFLAAVGRQRVAHVLIVPGVHRGALEDLVFREDGEQFGIGVAREALGFDGGDGGWDVEGLGSLCQADDVVLENLPVDRLHAEGHLRLLVDEDDLAVLRSEDFEMGHAVLLWG